MAGRVVDPDGKPVSDAAISALSVDPSSFDIPDVVTDANGAFVLNGLAPGKYEIEAQTPSGEISGIVSDAEVAKRATAIASIHAKTIVNLLQAPPPDSRQVMLQVMFATVDRTALSQLGVNLFSVNNKLIGTATTPGAVRTRATSSVMMRAFARSACAA